MAKNNVIVNQRLIQKIKKIRIRKKMKLRKRKKEK